MRQICSGIPREPLNKSYAGRFAGKIGMLTRRVTKVVAGLRCQEAQRCERSILPQPSWDGAWRVGSFVRLLAKGIDHSRCRLSPILLREAAVAPVWDLFRGSLASLYADASSGANLDSLLSSVSHSISFTIDYLIVQARVGKSGDAACAVFLLTLG